VLNRPGVFLELTNGTRAGRGTDGNPSLRTGWLSVCVLIPLVVIAGRAAYLQCAIADRFHGAFNSTTEEWEVIPVRDGRILAADGSILAGETERHELRVHYRWLQDPPNEEWLKRQAWRRLTRAERRDDDLVAMAKAEVLKQHEQLWRDLERLTQQSSAELLARRQEIQQRVEALAERVNQAAANRQGQKLEGEGVEPAVDGTFWRLAQSIWEELRTPPERPREEAFEILEQTQYHAIVDNLSPEIAAKFEADQGRYPGVRVAVEWKRTYPQNDLGAHWIGTRKLAVVGENSAKDAANHPDHIANQTSGISGLERQYNEHLSGVRGLKRLVRNRRGDVLREEVLREPRPGRDLVLTIDADLQRFAEQRLDVALSGIPVGEMDSEESASVDEAARAPVAPPLGGVLAAIDVRTGAILTLAASPRYNANLLLRAEAAEWQALLDDPRRPLFPRTTQMALPPGSVFKAISAIACTQAGGLDPNRTIYCQGFLDRPEAHRCMIFRHHGIGHGEMTLAEALEQSCNVYFFQSARRAGPRPLVEWADRLGVGRRTGVDLPDEAGGNLPRPETSRHRWHTADTLGLAIGQSTVLVTPLQMARVMAAIANDGSLVTPHFASQHGPRYLADDLAEPTTVTGAPELRPISDLDRATLAVVRKGLEAVVNDPRGTAYRTVRLDESRIAGKTGTAEVAGKPDHAWFAGYVPADRPRIAFCVVLEHGGSGSKAAGPVARDYVMQLVRTGLIPSESRLVQRSMADRVE
jgi:penicillin-binding protein 2